MSAGIAGRLPPLPTTVIEAIGSTSLIEVGTNFYLDSVSSGSGPSLKQGGIAVVAGQFGAWTPMARNKPQAVMTWHGRSPAPISTRRGVPIAAATTSRVFSEPYRAAMALESLETTFHQDLNKDGRIEPGFSLTFDDEFNSRSISRPACARLRRTSARSGVLMPTLTSGLDILLSSVRHLATTRSVGYTVVSFPSPLLLIGRRRAIQAAGNRAQGTFSQTYGYFEERAAFSNAKGAWDAFLATA
jgi:hypothetical protein